MRLPLVSLALAACLACSAGLPPREGPGPASGAGGALTRDDWVAHLPLACAATLVVVVVDAAFITKIVYDRRRRKTAPGASPASATRPPGS